MKEIDKRKNSNVRKNIKGSRNEEMPEKRIRKQEKGAN